MTIACNNFHVPDHLTPFSPKHKRITIEIDSLFVGVRSDQGVINYVSIDQSPIYLYLYDKITKKLSSSSHIDRYRNYIRTNTAITREQSLMKVYQSIKDNGFDSYYAPLVFRSGKRPFPFGRYDVADGHHRLCILKLLGHEKVNAVFFKVQLSKQIKSLLNSIVQES